MTTMLRIPFDDMHRVFVAALRRTGMDDADADRCGRLFAEASRDGVASHGLNRFPRFMRMIELGVVNVRARPECVARMGALERWNGHSAPGNLNAQAAMARAIVLGREHGIGCVAVAGTNHWMRGGSYGWQAAEAGVIGICWTNTLANLPPWGAADPRVGNNPLVIAVPRPAGHVVLDMAMSQFSVGGLDAYAARGEQLPVAGGYDEAGALSCDPAAIAASGRLLPVGFWKGSGLAIVLDLVAALVAGGLATHEIALEPERETRLSQIFICIDPRGDQAALADRVIAHLHQGHGSVRYPGERTIETRRRNLRDGVPVDAAIWEQVQALAAG